MHTDGLKGLYRQKTVLGRAAARRDADFGVDVEKTLDAARRPHGALETKLVRLEVVVVVGATDSHGGGDLFFLVLVLPF